MKSQERMAVHPEGARTTLNTNSSNTNSSALIIKLFGPLETRLDENALQGLHLREGERLLAYLILQNGVPISYRALAKCFWPSEAHVPAGQQGDFPNTRQGIYYLRRALGTEAYRLTSHSKGIVCLDMTGAEVDVLIFDQLVAQTDLASWREAVACYRAPLLQGWTDAWAVEARSRRKRSYERVLKQIVAQLAAQGEEAQSEPYLRRLIASTVNQESWWRELMTLQVKQGRYAEFEETYEEICSLLKRQDRTLEPETQQLADALRAKVGRADRHVLAAEARRASSAVLPTPPVLTPPLSLPAMPAVSVMPAFVAATVSPDIATPPAREAEGQELLEEIEREAGGGAVDLDSRFYIYRPTDRQFTDAIRQKSSIVLIKGPRQVGKTSLLARGLHETREQGIAVAFTDLQTLNEVQFASADTLFFTLATMLAMQLGLTPPTRQEWDPEFGANVNLEMFLRRQILAALSQHFVWAIDEVDRLFAYPYSQDVFGLFRSWHNRRSLEPHGPWKQLTLAFSYATEAHLFITDLNQSPFNVGKRLALEDFTPEQVQELNLLYGEPLRSASQLSRFHQIFGGQPYLVRQGLDALTLQGIDLDTLEAQADRDDGPFGDHLRRLWLLLAQDTDLADTVRQMLQGKECPSPTHFYRLRSVGIVSGEWGRDVRLRCRLYNLYFNRYLSAPGA